MNFAPLVFLGFIIFFMVMSARVRKQAEEARRAALRQQQEKNGTAPAEARPNPARPQQSSPAPATQARRPVKAPVQKTQAKPVVTPTIKPEATVTAEPKKPAAASPKQPPVPAEEAKNPIIQWNQNSAMLGIVMAEILGKPKALRR